MSFATGMAAHVVVKRISWSNNTETGRGELRHGDVRGRREAQIWHPFDCGTSIDMKHFIHYPHFNTTCSTHDSTSFRAGWTG